MPTNSENLSPRGEVAPLTVLIGAVLIRLLEWAEHIDFLLSVRDEKLATLLQVFRDFGWWIVGLGAAIWFLYEYRRHQKDETARGSIGSLVASAAFIAFLLGSFITVRATGSLPNVIGNYGGDTAKKICTADIDTSRLSGFEDDYRLILLCGMMDPSTDAMDDTRIAVSSPFHIESSTIGLKGIVAPLGNLTSILQTAGTPPTTSPGQTAVFQFQMWHAVALIPKGVESSSIKRASDVKQLGGRLLTEPVGTYGSPMGIPIPQEQQTTKQTNPKKTA